MSERHHHSRATAWVTSVIAALVVYVLSWPVIEIMCERIITAPRTMATATPSTSSSLTKTGVGTLILPQQPYGIRMLYRPLHKLCQPYDSHNLLYRYWEWWCARFGQGAYSIYYGDI